MYRQATGDAEAAAVSHTSHVIVSSSIEAAVSNCAYACAGPAWPASWHVTLCGLWVGFHYALMTGNGEANTDSKNRPQTSSARLTILHPAPLIDSKHQAIYSFKKIRKNSVGIIFILQSRYYD
ncbi:hypothetical protein MSG28_000508 [Choristoneura fumiferana]|uniref:Uncharacterized protein n=1 Tax=Choristoneura fumiferana TaxID=7141 RepID=A0ACC0K0X5_CHOFU|nr:hypothetical protein MSG28_000508 [Choristoneura fumiferana]